VLLRMERKSGWFGTYRVTIIAYLDSEHDAPGVHTRALITRCASCSFSWLTLTATSLQLFSWMVVCRSTLLGSPFGLNFAALEPAPGWMMGPAFAASLGSNGSSSGQCAK
jgi:hypothetical protein